MSAKVVAFNREKNGRIKYTVNVRFEQQNWNIFKYYTDFLNLRNNLECSQYNFVARDLPPKHPLRLKLRVKLSLTRRRGMRKELSFIMARMQRLEEWLNIILETTGPLGIYHVKFLDDFFEAFPDDEPYMRPTPRAAHVEVEQSMFHALKIMGVPDDVYTKLWTAGFCFDSMARMTPQQWLGFGVSQVLSYALFRKFRKHRESSRSRNASQSSLCRILALPAPTPNVSDTARDVTNTPAISHAAEHVPPPYSGPARMMKETGSVGAPVVATAPPASERPHVPSRSRKPSGSSMGAETASAASSGSAAITIPQQRMALRASALPSSHLTTIQGSPPNATITEVRERQQRALEACAMLSRRRRTQIDM